MLPIPKPKYSDLEFLLYELIAEAGWQARHDVRVYNLSEPWYKGPIPLPIHEITQATTSDYIYRVATLGWKKQNVGH